MNSSPVQLEMVWPPDRQTPDADTITPAGYRLRLGDPGDREALFALMERAGWPSGDRRRLELSLPRVVPGSWHVAECTDDGLLVASALGLDDPTPWHPAGAELGWVAADPDHRGRGLGLAVCAAVTARLIEVGCRDVHLYTDEWRLAAVKTYLRLGYLPLIFAPEILPRWRTVCEALAWPYTPAAWPTAAEASQWIP
ncbi:MAG: GNAT family N-acetyltransferase [Anaerolineae bacterium]|nr:GNAT family N-acetyltransferase [Anaerolineae bacterium]